MDIYIYIYIDDSAELGAVCRQIQRILMASTNKNMRNPIIKCVGRGIYILLCCLCFYGCSQGGSEGSDEPPHTHTTGEGPVFASYISN